MLYLGKRVYTSFIDLLALVLVLLFTVQLVSASKHGVV